MLTVALDDFMVELKDGAFHHVGASTKSGTAKLYDITEAEARAFGDERVKFAFADDSGNSIEVALHPGELEQLLDDVESVRESGSIEGFGSETDPAS